MTRKKYTLGCQVEKDLYDRYGRHATINGTTPSEVIRSILIEHLDELDGAPEEEA